MKSIFRAGWLIFICAARSWTQGTDTAAASRPDTVAEAREQEAPLPEAPLPEPQPAQAQAPLPLELVAPEKYGQVTVWLRANGIGLPGGTPVSMGFEPDHRTLVVIMLDAGGQPVKKVLETDPSLYQQVMGVPVPESAPELESDPPAAGDRSQEGRLYFITHTALKSLYVYPLAYSTLMHASEFNIVAGLSLLTFGGAVYGSYKFTADRQLGYGRVAGMNYGGELALTYAQLMKWLVHSREDRPSYYYDYDYYDRPHTCQYVKAWMNMVGLPLGIYLGAKVPLADNHDYGKIAVMRFLGRSAILYGMVIPWLFYDDDGVLVEVIFESDHYHDRATRSYGTIAPLFCMGLIPAGNYIGRKLAEEKTYSSGRSVLIETAGIMGAVSGFIFPSLFECQTRNVYLVSGLLGHAAGTAIGFNYHRDLEYRFSQGAFMALSAAGGAAVALGIPLIFDADDHQAYTIAGTAGGWLGLVLGENLSRKIFEKSDKDRRALNIDLPILRQWPLVVSSYKSGRPVKAEIISVEF